jgi:hypothetical protein
VVTGGIVAGGVAVVHPARTRAARPTRSVVVEARSVEPPAEVVPVMAAPSAAAPEHLGHAEQAAAPQPSSSPDVLAREVKALKTVQALLGHDPEVALRLLDRYQAQFPHGSLSSEATVLRAQALLAKGDRAGAQALVDGYSSAHPDSLYAKWLKRHILTK